MLGLQRRERIHFSVWKPVGEADWVVGTVRPMRKVWREFPRVAPSTPVREGCGKQFPCALRGAGCPKAGEDPPGEGLNTSIAEAPLPSLQASHISW